MRKTPAPFAPLLLGLALFGAAPALAQADAPPPPPPGDDAPPPPGAYPRHDGHHRPPPPASRREAEDRALRRFARLDLNGDGVVTREEFDRALPRMAPGGPGSPGPGGDAPPHGFGMDEADRGPLDGVPPPGAGSANADHAGLPVAPPPPPPPHGMGRRMDLFDRMDLNHDGRITRDEAVRFADRMYERHKERDEARGPDR